MLFAVCFPFSKSGIGFAKLSRKHGVFFSNYAHIGVLISSAATQPLLIANSEIWISQSEARYTI